jgi:hypothetical protein
MAISYLDLEEDLLSAIGTHITTYLARLRKTVKIRAGAQLERPFGSPIITLALYAAEPSMSGGMNYYGGDEGDATQMEYYDVSIFMTLNTDDSCGNDLELGKIHSLLTTVVFMQQRHQLLASLGALTASLSLNNEVELDGWWQKQYTLTAKVMVQYPSVTL